MLVTGLSLLIGLMRPAAAAQTLVECFYEKVVKVKADVAALHIFSFRRRILRWRGELSRALPLGNVHLDL